MMKNKVKKFGAAGVAMLALDAVLSLTFGVGGFNFFHDLDVTHMSDTIQCQLGNAAPGFCKNL